MTQTTRERAVELLFPFGLPLRMSGEQQELLDRVTGALEAEAPVQPLEVTVEVLDAIGPVVVLGRELMELAERLELLHDAAEAVERMWVPTWTEEARQRMQADLTEQLGRVRQVLDRITAALPVDAPDEDEVED